MTSDPFPGEEDDLVFVYGALRRGASQELRMDGAVFIASGEVAGQLVRIEAFPAFVPGAAGKWVKGEVFRISPELLARVEEFQQMSVVGAESGGFRRIRVEVNPEGSVGMVHVAWSWQWTGPVDQQDLIHSGDWLDAEQPRRAPWFTLVALACLASTLPCLVSAALLFSGDPWLRLAGGLATSGTVLAPVSSWVAAVFAERRRERWVFVRKLVSVAAVMILIVNILVLLPAAFSLLR